MKIKCASCNEKTISITETWKRYIITFPKCNTELLYDIDSSKFNKIFFSTIIPLALVGFLFKPNNFQLWIALILYFIFIFSGAFFFSITKIKPGKYSPPPIAIKHSLIVIILLFTYVSMFLLIKNLQVQFVLGTLGWFLLGYLIYIFKRASKHK